ncbi:MAG: hypothetical protein IJZ35_01765 [Clostridia bacterium]|nr:hypothetical protein [Clostridia bacterium]
MKIVKKILCIAIPVIVVIVAAIALVASGTFNSFKFTVDTTEKGNTLSNVASNVNIWSIEGNPFVNATASEEYNIFEFVDYVQLMQCSGGTEARDLFIDPTDTSTMTDYDFTLLIENCRGVLNLGAKPMLKLGSVPLKYTQAARTDHGFNMNPYPPDDYDVYYNYIYALAEALVEEFGREEVLSWRFGVMTEYENKDWFMSVDEDPENSAEAYCRLYDYTVQALIDAVGEDVFVGAHSMTVTEGLWDEAIFIEHCAKGTNYKTGETGTRLCYLSTSFYDSNPGYYTKGYTLPESIEYLRDTAEKYGFNDLIYGVDEGRILCGITSGSTGDELLTRICGYTYQASYDARLYKQMFENDINYFSSWGYLSGGLLSGNPTVSYHVAKCASEFENSELVETKKGSGLIFGAEVDAVSAYDDETDTLRIMAYNFKNDMDYTNEAELDFEISAPEFEGKNVTVTTYVIDDDCNYFDEWIKDRENYGITDDCFSWSPDDPQIDNTTTLADEDAREIYYSELYAKYYECSKLEPETAEMTVTDGKIQLNITLDPHAVVFYEITETN